MLEKCPYCATNHSKDLFNCSGSDYFVSVSYQAVENVFNGIFLGWRL